MVGRYIVHTILIIFLIIVITDCLLIIYIFKQNKVYSNLSSANGGAILFSRMTNLLKNCSFDNNTAETFLKIFLVTGNEPCSYGGAIRSSNSNLFFTECKFTNNTGFGNSMKLNSIMSIHI